MLCARKLWTKPLLRASACELPVPRDGRVIGLHVYKLALRLIVVQRFPKLKLTLEFMVTET